MPAWFGPSTERAGRTRRRLLRAAAGLAIVLAAGGAAGQDLTPSALELNRADRAELESLPGLGPSLVGRVLAAREQTPFEDWQDLARRVKGMGPRLSARLSAAGLRVNGQAWDAAAPGRFKPASSPRP